MRRQLTQCGVAALTFVSLPTVAQSICYGTVSNGRLEGGVKLPSDGSNFSGYSDLAAAAGRTYVHSLVRDVTVAAYAALAQSHPDKRFVYGETGFDKGGRFKPHRTHQNGLSVDFMTPVLDMQGRSVPLPTNALNRYGYDIEFDRDGRFGELRIDFDAMGEHLYQLHQAALARGVDLALVILDPGYHDKLFATKRGSYLRSRLRFMPKQAWVRHDDHYHVDFKVQCRPMKKS